MRSVCCLKFVRWVFVLVALAMVAGCAMTPTMPSPSSIVAPEPIRGCSGRYMCPYTSDGVVAEWVDKGMHAKMGATIGKTAGAYAGQKAFEQIPFVGGILGSKVGEAAGRAIAIEACGGWDYIKKTSDLSFNSVDKLAVYLYAKYSTNEHYSQVLKATKEIYPDLEKRYYRAIQNAPRS